MRCEEPSFDYEQCDRCIRKSVSFYPSVLADGIGTDPKVAYDNRSQWKSRGSTSGHWNASCTEMDLRTHRVKEFMTTEAAGVPRRWQTACVQGEGKAIFAIRSYGREPD
jgi:hypothetical protein